MSGDWDSHPTDTAGQPGQVGPLDVDPVNDDTEPSTPMAPVGIDEPGRSPERGGSGRVFGIDIDELTADMVAGMFRKTMHKHVTAVVTETVDTAVAAVLDEDAVEDLRARAESATRDAVAQLLADGGPDPDGTAPALYYGSVDEFVREYLIGAYRRRIDGQHRVWAANWWEYDEAVIRLEALWRAWEHFRQDPATGMSVWWREHADHHMSILFHPEGPFASAKETDQNRNKKGEPLPYTHPPHGLFPDQRTPGKSHGEAAHSGSRGERVVADEEAVEKVDGGAVSEGYADSE